MATVSQQLRHLVASVLLLCALKVEWALGDALSGWETGRATFYGSATDPWKLSHGHCQYGFLSKTKCTGWDVAAIADQNRDFNRADSSCGRCYEVKCKNGWITDGYGEKFDRNICFHKKASVVVQIVDLCECNYAPNAYSNRRWCCGDYQHFDLSVNAFAKLMPLDKGVGQLEFRRVTCDHEPEEKAWYPSGNPPPDGEYPPWNWNGNDGRTCPSGTKASTARRRRAPAPRRRGQRVRSGGGSNVSIGRWSINSWTGGGVGGRTATACGTLLPWGGFTFNNLGGKRRLDIWVKKEGGNLPNLVVKGGNRCRARHIRNLPKIGYNGNYIRVRVGLSSLNCGRVNKVIMQNNIGNWGWQNVCIDQPRAA